MKLVVDSGATKGDWRLIAEDGSLARRELYPGTNVSAMDTISVCGIINEALRAFIADAPQEVHFYTAGILSDEIRLSLKNSFESLIPFREVEIQDDLLGAARSVLGSKPGIVAIMGTGSNACMYDGSRIFRKVGSGGYVLGDDGSGAALGRLFLRDFIKNLVPKSVADDFSKEFDSSYEAIVAKVYHSPSPSGFLGSIAPFLLAHIEDPYVLELVRGSFRDFIERSIKAYDVSRHEVGVVGGLGYAFRDVFAPLATASGVKIKCFRPTPIDGLVEYHSTSYSPRKC